MFTVATICRVPTAAILSERDIVSDVRVLFMHKHIFYVKDFVCGMWALYVLSGTKLIMPVQPATFTEMRFQ